MSRDLDHRLEEAVRDMYREVAAETPPLGPLQSEIRHSQGRRRRHSVLNAVAAAASVIAIIGVLQVLRHQDGPLSTDAPSQQNAPTSAPADEYFAQGVTGTWRATLLSGKRPPTSEKARYEPLLQFRSDGTFTAYDSCISIAGEYSISQAAETLKFSSVRSRLALCGPHYAHPFEATTGFKLRDGANELLLVNQSGEVLAAYENVRR